MSSYKPIEFYDRYGNNPKDGFATFNELGSYYFTFNKNAIAVLISKSYATDAERNFDLTKAETQIKRRDNFKIVKKGLANYNLILNDTNKNELCISRSYTSAIKANEVLFGFYDFPQIEVENKDHYNTNKITKEPVQTNNNAASESNNSYNTSKNNAEPVNQNKDLEAKTLARREALLHETKSERSYLPLLLLALIPILCLMLLYRNCNYGGDTALPIGKKEIRKNFEKATGKVKSTTKKAGELAKNAGNKTEEIAKKVTGKASNKTKDVVNRAKEMKKNVERSASFVKEEIERDASGYELGSIESEIYKCLKNQNCYTGKRFLWGETKFKNNSATISGEAHKSLINIARMMQRNQNMRLTISGNSLTSEDEYSRTEGLSTARANAVKNFLKAHGASDERIYAYGNGQGNYINYNNNAKADYQNKRIDFVLDGK